MVPNGFPISCAAPAANVASPRRRTVRWWSSRALRSNWDNRFTNNPMVRAVAERQAHMPCRWAENAPPPWTCPPNWGGSGMFTTTASQSPKWTAKTTIPVSIGPASMAAGPRAPYTKRKTGSMHRPQEPEVSLAVACPRAIPSGAKGRDATTLARNAQELHCSHRLPLPSPIAAQPGGFEIRNNRHPL